VNYATKSYIEIASSLFCCIAPRLPRHAFISLITSCAMVAAAFYCFIVFSKIEVSLPYLHACLLKLFHLRSAECSCKVSYMLKELMMQFL